MTDAALKLIRYLIVLKLSVAAGTSPPDPYHFVCEVQTLGDGFPPKLPPMCTAMASYSKTNEGMEAVLPIRDPKMPFVRLFEDLGSDKWSEIFKNDNEIENHVQIITKNKITAVAFAFESNDDNDDKVSPERTDEILGFIGKLRAKCPDTLFGLFLVLKSDKLKNGYDLNKVDPKIDFYICHVNSERKCGDEVERPPIDDSEMAVSIDVLKKENYNMAKTLLFINIVHHSHWSGFGPSDYSYIPYGHTCSIPHSGNRYMCSDTLEDFFNKGKLAATNKMKGLFVYSADYDDVHGACYCEDEDKSTTFPILKVLEKGLENAPSGGKLIDCKTWGFHKDDE